MKDRQSTLVPKPPKIYSKKILRSDYLTYYPSESRTFEEIMNDLVQIHKRTALYELRSGSKDSTCVADRLAKMDEFSGVVHIKTNIDLQVTIDHISDYCQEMGWPLRIIEPQHKFVYYAFCLEHGFPGPGIHRWIMGLLKYQTMRNFALSVDRKNHALVSGVRQVRVPASYGQLQAPDTVRRPYVVSHAHCST